ncbi:MAG: hypothetical protein IGS03_05390 [Candidatus Sericytochromatia bacterium]|nr:hypothetical protein [Candidatus Sericytochromatia bacterium]
MKPIKPRSPWVWLLSAVLTLSACGGGNSTAGPAPNTGNIPNLATRPSAQAAQVKKTRLAGEVFDASSRRPIEKASIQLQIVTLAAPVAPSVAPTSSGASPTSSASAVPTPGPGLPPNTQPGPAGTASPGAQATVPPFAPDQSMPTLSPIDPFASPPAARPSGENPPPGETPALPGDAPLSGLESLPRQAFWSARGARGTAFQLAQNTASARPSPTPNPDAPNLFKTDTNNRGKFFINDVPEGTYVLTIMAPGYRTLTLTDVNPNQLNIPLTPLDNTEQVDVVGMVMSPADIPVADAVVSSSFSLGEAIGIPANANEMGEFKLLSVSPGRRSLLALTFDAQEQIKQMGLLKDLPLSIKNMKVKAQALAPDKKTGPSPSPTPDSAKRKELEESVENLLRESPLPEESAAATEAEDSPAADTEAQPEADLTPATDPIQTPDDLPSEPLETVTEEQEEAKEKRGFNLLDSVRELVTGESTEESNDEKIYPVISLRSVLNNVELAGTVTLPEGYQFKQVEVFLTLPEPKEGVAQEIYMLSRSYATAAPEPPEAEAASPSAADQKKADQKKKMPRFRLQLPELDKEHSYHLQLTATDAKGALSYHHLYNLKESATDLSASFLPVSEKIELEGEDVNAIPPVPGMAWSPVEGAELYHVTLARGSGLNRQVFWEAWTKETQLVYPLTSREHRLKEQETYTFSVAAIKGLRPARNSSQEKYALLAYGAIWTDLSRQTYPPFEVVE